MRKRLRVLINGRVQGVNFRWATYEKALQLNLCGFVKNTPGRKVEAVFEGEEEDLKEVLDFVQKGPPAAKVREVEKVFSECLDEFSDFTIDY